MPTLLHISDLHRTAAPRLDNDDLIAAICSDSRRWEQENIPQPEFIVVSGDLIQGPDRKESDPDAEIASQYLEADRLLRSLAEEFVGSDLSRVMVVPGNHDVSWHRAHEAMSPLEECPAGIGYKEFNSDSGLRWNWSNRQAYEIVDGRTYESRLRHFRDFQSEFYRDLDPNPLSHGCEDLVFLHHPSLGCAIAGFASWNGNDCFCHVGEIRSEAINVSRRLLEESDAPLGIAVWHHSLVGGPRASDYMDVRVTHRLIDFGFNVGLHGHQHFPGAVPFELRLPNLTSMVVVGAGSIAVGDRGLPTGERRQFNLICIDSDQDRVTVHVREMSEAGVFMASFRNDFGGKSYSELSFKRPTARRSLSTVTRTVDDAMSAVARGDFESALGLCDEFGVSHSQQKRQIMMRSLDGLGRAEELIELLDPPQNSEEAVMLISLLLKLGEFDVAEAKLGLAGDWIDASLIDQLRARILIGRMSP